MREVVRGLVLVVCALVIPHVALAQAVIAGSVKDTSGAVLPGVTVEAASPVLIEKVRTAVSDGNGVYRIEDLRPGTYTVTFTLPGFATLKREGIVLTGSFTASVDAEMKVGGLEETVTVTGESPDRGRVERPPRDHDRQRNPEGHSDRAQLQRAGRRRARRRHQPQRHRGRHLDHAVPDPRRPQQRRPHDDRRPQRRQPSRRQSAAGVRGRRRQRRGSDLLDLGRSRRVGDRRPDDERRAEDGRQPRLRLGLLQRHQREPAVQEGIVRPACRRRTTTSTTSTAALAARSSRTRSGTSSTPARRAASVRTPTSSSTSTPAMRRSGCMHAVEPGFSDRTWENVSGRVTWQANSKNKISGFWDEQATCRRCEGQTSGITDPARVSPEAGSVGATKPLRVMQASWSSPMTSRLLLDAGFGGVYYGWGSFERDPNPDARSHPRHRAVRRRLRQQRRHRRPRVPLAGLQHQQHRILRLEGQRLVRHRLPQHEGRLSGHVDGRQPSLDDQRHEPDVPRQQRRPQPAPDVAVAVSERRQRRLARRRSCRSSGRADG